MSRRRKGHIAGVNWDAVPDLGVTSDMEIARRLGVTGPAVRSARAVRGIAPAMPPGNPKRHRRPPVPASEAALTQTVESALAAQGLRVRIVSPWDSAIAGLVILGLCLLALAVRGCA